VSNIGDGTVQVIELRGGRLRSVGKVSVGAGPKRIAWLQVEQRGAGSMP
jgi:hypothetical protein